MSELIYQGETAAQPKCSKEPRPTIDGVDCLLHEFWELLPAWQFAYSSIPHAWCQNTTSQKKEWHHAIEDWSSWCTPCLIMPYLRFRYRSWQKALRTALVWILLGAFPFLWLVKHKHLYVQPADIGWPTGNRKKLSNCQAQLGQATCLAVAYLLSISCRPSYVRRLYMGYMYLQISEFVDSLKAHLLAPSFF